MKLMPRMNSVMTPFPHTIDCSESIAAAEALMITAKIRHLPVLEQRKIVGVLSDRDIKLSKSLSDKIEAEDDLCVGDICSMEAYVVDSEERLDTVAHEMMERRIGSALVTRGEKLVGIFTTTDACRELAELLKHHYPDA